MPDQPKHRTIAERAKSDEGVTLTFVVIMLFALLGVAGLAVDFGIGFLTLRDAQNAAEASATAAALESCNATTGTDAYGSPMAAGVAVAEANDFPIADVSVFQTTNGGWGADIDTQAPVVFLGIFGLNSIPVHVVAEATCPKVEALDGAAIFAQTWSCYNGFQQLNLSSSYIFVEGDIISNSNLKISSAGVVTGDIIYSADESINLHPSLDVQGSVIPADASFFNPYPIPYPYELQELYVSDGSGGGSFSSVQWAWIAANGAGNIVDVNEVIDQTFLVDNGYATVVGTELMIDPGFYRTSADIDLNTGNSRVRGTNVTFIAGGRATFHDPDMSGNTIDVQKKDGSGPLAEIDSTGQPTGNTVKLDLTAFSADGNSGCSTSQPAIDSTGAIAWEGILFAPFGHVDFSGASSTVNIDGGVYGFMVSSSGATLEVHYDPGQEQPNRAWVNINH